MEATTITHTIIHDTEAIAISNPDSNLLPIYVIRLMYVRYCLFGSFAVSKSGNLQQELSNGTSNGTTFDEIGSAVRP